MRHMLTHAYIHKICMYDYARESVGERNATHCCICTIITIYVCSLVDSCSSSSQVERVNVFWGNGIGGRPEETDGILVPFVSMKEVM